MVARSALAGQLQVQRTLLALADAAAYGLIDDLQAGLDASDADRYDHRFADEILWECPYGATITGIRPAAAQSITG